MSIQVFNQDGIEVYVDTATSKSFASVSGYARMASKAKSTISRRFKYVGRNSVKRIRVKTSMGLQVTSLVASEFVVSWLAKDCPDKIPQFLDALRVSSAKIPKKFSVGNKKKARYKKPEYRVQSRLANKENGRIEIVCKTGKIDILTDTQIIEIKKSKDWKHAVGQVLVYQIEFPNHEARIHLYEKCSEEFKRMVISYCSKLNIVVTFET